MLLALRFKFGHNSPESLFGPCGLSYHDVYKAFSEELAQNLLDVLVVVQFHFPDAESLEIFFLISCRVIMVHHDGRIRTPCDLCLPLAPMLMIKCGTSANDSYPAVSATR